MPDTLVSFSPLEPFASDFLLGMARTEAEIAQAGDIEFCTLGMFILGMLIIFKTPRIRRSRCIAQMTLISVAPDPVSRISLEALLLLQS